MRVLFGILLLGMSVAAHAARVVPIINYESVPVPIVPGKQITVDDVREAIVAAAKQRQWSVSERPNNVIHAAYSARGGKHVAVVEVRFTDKSYSIKYLDSVNLMYSEEGGQPVIHKAYNAWVSELRGAIDLQLKFQ
jgi:hypothetical protein